MQSQLPTPLQQKHKNCILLRNIDYSSIHCNVFDFFPPKSMDMVSFVEYYLLITDTKTLK